jgi:hypothetical protein
VTLRKRFHAMRSQSPAVGSHWGAMQPVMSPRIRPGLRPDTNLIGQLDSPLWSHKHSLLSAIVIYSLFATWLHCPPPAPKHKGLTSNRSMLRFETGSATAYLAFRLRDISFGIQPRAAERHLLY